MISGYITRIKIENEKLHRTKLKITKLQNLKLKTLVLSLSLSLPVIFFFFRVPEITCPAIANNVFIIH